MHRHWHTWTYDCVQLIIYYALICCVAIPCMIACAILAVRVALLALVVECTIALLSGQSVREFFTSCKGTACCFVVCRNELAIFIQATNFVFDWVCIAPVFGLQDVDVADAGEVFLDNASAGG